MNHLYTAPTQPAYQRALVRCPLLPDDERERT